MKHAQNPKIMEILGITHIVNATKTVANAFEPSITYMRADLTDLESEYIDAYFDEAYEFIEEALEKNESRVLVHCAFGVSRSASLVIMYLMKYFQVSYDEAFAHTKACREMIDPNEGFKNQMMKFEKNSRMVRSSSSDFIFS